MSERLLTAAELADLVARLLRLRLDPDVEVDPVPVEDDLALADVGPHDDPVIKHHFPLERNLTCELNSHGPVREVKTRVVSGRDQESSTRAVRHR